MIALLQARNWLSLGYVLAEDFVEEGAGVEAGLQEQAAESQDDEPEARHSPDGVGEDRVDDAEGEQAHPGQARRSAHPEPGKGDRGRDDDDRRQGTGRRALAERDLDDGRDHRQVDDEEQQPVQRVVGVGDDPPCIERDGDGQTEGAGDEVGSEGHPGVPEQQVGPAVRQPGADEGADQQQQRQRLDRHAAELPVPEYDLQQSPPGHGPRLMTILAMRECMARL